MSTKNLARTAIEGGRANLNRWTRRHSHGRIRVRTQAFLALLRSGADPEGTPVPARERVPRWFHDKLSPVERWLASQVGRPWDKVRAEIFARFDTRTTAGRHIVFEHILPEVEACGLPTCDSCYDFAVDRHGILRRRVRPARDRHRLSLEDLPRSRSELEAWLAGRLIGTQGDVAFWFIPTATGAYRQHRRLAEDDLALWRSLPEWFRRRNDPADPSALRQNRI
jgi:hypothetical protein